jgi:pSer/pThr/pTyr-binding forkhead associated (FHA) protein
MQLSFPNSEHRDVNFAAGEVSIGSRAEMMISVANKGLAAHHASIYADRRGIWLKVVANQQGVHLNGRPIKQLAFLRSGDLLCIEQLRIQLRESDSNSIVRQIPAAGPNANLLNEVQKVSAARVLLRSLSGQHFGRTYGLVTPVSIGSGINADICLDDSAVSEKHATVEWHGERVVLRASSPTSISYVNGVAVSDAMLSPGDQITIEQARFLLEAPGLPLRGKEIAVPSGTVAHTQTIQAVKASAKAAQENTLQDVNDDASDEPHSSEDSNSLWWLIAAAALLAASLTALLVYAPRGGI